MSMEQWKEFFKMKKSVLFLFVLTIVSSTLYVIYLEQMGQLSKEMLQHYVVQKEIPFEMSYFLAVFMGYLKKFLLVWFLGWFSFSVPLSFLMIYIYIFSYGFSITSLYIGFGLQGIGISILSFGVAGMMVISYMLYLADYLVKKKQSFEEITQQSYLFLGLIGVGIVWMVSLVECLNMFFL